MGLPFKLQLSNFLYQQVILIPRKQFSGHPLVRFHFIGAVIHTLGLSVVSLNHPFMSILTSLRKTLKAKFKFRIAICTIVIVLTACNRYYAESTEGWAIDADTKKPIEGVIVVANWQLHKSTLNGKKPAAHLNIIESTTNSSGRYFIRGWGPKTASWGFFIDRDPQLLFYKEGYEYRSLKNFQVTETNTSNVRQSAWNGKTIELRRFDGDLKDYSSHLSSLHASMRSILQGEKCEWKRTPQLVLAVTRQEEIFRERDISSDLISLDDISGYFCGSAEDYLESTGILSSANSS